MKLGQILLLLPLSYAWDITNPFPSCLKPEISWEQANVFDIVVNSTSAEECQATCADRETCVSFTWLSEESPILPHSCALFSKTGDELACKNCVSGASECLCTAQGECSSQDDNMIEAIPQTLSLRECKVLCDDNSECNEYTYFGDQHMLSHLCLLFSSCETLAETDEDCVTGSKDCEVCSFEDTQGGLCEAKCESGWHDFEDHCYKLLGNYRTNHIDDCTKECVQAGGQLPSIHSQEENEFVYSLGQTVNFIWLGGNYAGWINYNWTDGTAWNYDNWAPGEPDGSSCVFMTASSFQPEQWISGICNGSELFDCICKK